MDPLPNDMSDNDLIERVDHFIEHPKEYADVDVRKRAIDLLSILADRFDKLRGV